MCKTGLLHARHRIGPLAGSHAFGQPHLNSYRQQCLLQTAGKAPALTAALAIADMQRLSDSWELADRLSCSFSRRLGC